MKPKILYFLLFFLLTSAHIASPELACATGRNGDTLVKAEGFGTTRSDALLKAKRDAVEQGVGLVIISETEVKNFEVKKDVVLTKTIGAVKKYNVLKEEKQPDGVYYIKIEATVALAKIKDDLIALKILLESMDRPRMMVVMREEDGDYAQSAIVDYLSEKGFDLVDAAVVAALTQKDDNFIHRATDGDPVAAARIGAENSAEYIIVGKVKKSLASSDFLSSTGMKSGQACITAKVVNCSNARVVASKSASAAAVHTDEELAKMKAVEKAAMKLMDQKLFEKILSSFQDTANNGIVLDIAIKNVVSFKEQKKIKSMLAETPGVVSVNKRCFGKGRLALSVIYKGDADSFSEAVDGKQFGNQKLSVIDIEGSRVSILLENRVD